MFGVSRWFRRGVRVSVSYFGVFIFGRNFLFFGMIFGRILLVLSLFIVKFFEEFGLVSIVLRRRKSWLSCWFGIVMCSLVF